MTQSKQSEQRSTCRGVRQRETPVEGVRDLEVVKHLCDQRRDRVGGSVNDRYLTRLHTSIEQGSDLSCNQLQLGTRTATLQQSHSLSGLHSRDVVVQQRALQMV